MKSIPSKNRLTKVEAWGMASASVSYVYRPNTIQGILDAIEEARIAGLKVAFKGTGNSYGDAFQCSEGVVIDLSRMNRIIDWSPDSGVVECEAGVTIRDLWRYTIEDGWWIPVVSGTSFVTLGGALSANIHGKNNFHEGPIGEHVLSFDLLTPDGRLFRVSPEENSELFYAAIGGFGLLGCIVSVRLQMKKIYSGLLNVEAIAVRNWDEAFSVFERRLPYADYLVGWIDCFASGRSCGRGQIHFATYLKPGEDPHPEESLSVSAQELRDTTLGFIPRSKLWFLMKPWVNPLGMRIINSLKYFGAVREHGHKFTQPLVHFNFLLDSAPNWKWCYRPGGLIQYQPFIPTENAPKTFEKIVTLCQERGLVPYLAVLKKHRRDLFLLSHAVDGYSLALDFPVTRKNRERLWSLLRALDEIVLDAGGRFYFAKDSTCSPGTVRKFLGDEVLHRFFTLKHQYDPEEILETELYRRVFKPILKESRAAAV
ncbi:MAG TPA: FAD-binding oxidoreductase [Fimbriimonadales bacterium]|nr:FAD-binding oxidoreductase [Fimbriimonadales bacterium]